MVFIGTIIGAMDPKPTGSKLDPEDDVPELTDEELDKLFKNGVWKIGSRIVSPEEGMAAMREALDSPQPPDPSP